ncbi:MAG: filamentous hemagglutinin N-terminal domain-containing protein, partial [Cyanobacteria bacterium SBLK]|nr:filamentous hemagglutinin N-terminal domain-containing protein [Cyanobacteria bacterium SBLK]
MFALSLWSPPIAIAGVPVPIVPEANGTGTEIDTNGQQFDIGGGILSGGNLFHSFEQFGLNEGQIANFLSAPSIHNIFGRVVGGDPSIINGLIQVTGGNSNLFLMNPAGMVFGTNASLNVPGDFTATTATAIGFGGDRWFNAFGNNNYADLTGVPFQFAFDNSQPAAILNHGNLSASNLTLLGGSVTSTGALQASGGSITLSAVPGTSLVRISQAGHLLNLELPSDRIPPDFSPLHIPEVLTGEPATATISGDVDASNPDGIGGNIALLANTIEVDGHLNASGRDGGGNIWIGGDYLGGGELPTADYTTVSSDSTIRADAIANGDGGTIIIWSDRTTNAGNASISARGGASSGSGGLVETSGKYNLVFTGNPDLSAPRGTGGTWAIDPADIVVTPGSLTETDLSASQISTIESSIGESLGLFFAFQQDIIEASTAGTITLISLDHIIVMEGLNGGKLTTPTDLLLQAGLDGTGSVFLHSDINVNGEATILAPDSVHLNSSIAANALTLSAGDRIASLHPLSLQTNSSLTLSASEILLPTTTIATNGGNATLTALNGNLSIGDIATTGGDIDLTATDSIATGRLDSAHSHFPLQTADAGDITLNAGGDIDIGDRIRAHGILSGNGGDVRLEATGSISLSLGAGTTGYNGGDFTAIAG